MVYVDNAFIPYRGMKMCHLIADSTEELLAAVDAIGVRRKWIQHPGTAKEHFDICSAMRTRAVEQGCVQISWMEYGRMIRDRLSSSAPGEGRE